MTQTMRKIVKIDEDRCDGCGLCVPDCAEGAIKVIDGKARLLAENLCDGLGACLGVCPKDAITIEERAADEFDEEAVEACMAADVAGGGTVATPASACQTTGAAPAEPAPCGCPGAMLRDLSPAPVAAEPAQPAAGATAGRVSRLSQWPVQLSLLPAGGAMWEGADVLIAADCVAFAMPDFHERLLADKKLAIACPKLDNVQPYVDKLAAVFAGAAIKSITVAHMEVPCCTGIVVVVRKALAQAGRSDIPIRDLTISLDGKVAREA